MSSFVSSRSYFQYPCDLLFSHFIAELVCSLSCFYSSDKVYWQYISFSFSYFYSKCLVSYLVVIEFFIFNFSSACIITVPSFSVPEA